MISTVLLNLTSVSEPQADEAFHNVLLYYMDDSESELSKSIYKQLAQNPDYKVTYSGLHHMGLKAAQEKIEHEIKTYSLGVYLYVPEDIEERLKNEEQAFYLFEGGYDDRVSMLMQKLTIYAKQYQRDTLSSGAINEKISIHPKPEKTYYIDEQGQLHHEVENGYSFSIHMFIGLIGIVFSWTQFQLFAIWRVQKEEGINERIALSGMSPWISVLERCLALMVLLVVQCLSVLIGISCLVQVDLKITVTQIIVSAALLGVALDCFSYLIETLFRQSPIGVYMALFALTISNLFSGIYFPFDVRANWQEQVACFLPQHQLIRCWSGMAQSKEGAFLFYAVWIVAFCFFELALAQWIKGIQNASVLEGLSDKRRTSILHKESSENQLLTMSYLVMMSISILFCQEELLQQGNIWQFPLVWILLGLFALRGEKIVFQVISWLLMIGVVLALTVHFSSQYLLLLPPLMMCLSSLDTMAYRHDALRKLEM